MKGYVLTRKGLGRTMELREVPEPTAADNEVLIRVEAAGLNPVDSKVQAAGAQLVWPLDLPRVAGSELSGVVEDVGRHVTGFKSGDRVFARVNKRKLGAYAKYCVVEEDLVAIMPDTLGFEDAAGLPLAGLTAWQGLQQIGAGPGQRVFISGGAGGVGTLAIQLAVQMGAEVATTASAEGAKLVHSLGAATVIDYRTQQFKDVLSDYDGAFLLTGGRDLMDAFTILKRGGNAVSITHVDPTTAREDLSAGPVIVAATWAANSRTRARTRRAGINYRSLLMHPSGEDLAVLADLVERDRLKPVTDRVFPFEEISDAFTYLDQGHAKGKVIVRL
ncbi:MAG TPA: NADP-dependent oxidoreductase [Acidimicrobiales bacterium]|nr:NADP-dependent oxidoreductase [Acidimicrobiales bacterium]